MSALSEAFGGSDHEPQLVPGSLRGYRTWRRAGRFVRVPDGRLPLTSVTRRHVLWARTLHAECTDPDLPFLGTVRPPLTDAHRSPAPACECGIYAWHAPDDTDAFDAGVLGVFGAVEASGLVLIGDRGFRAEHAQVVAVVTRNRRLAEACRAAGIAVYRHRRDLLVDHPPEDLSALLGDDPSGSDARPEAPAWPAPPPLPRFGSRIGRVLWYAVWARAALVTFMVFVLPFVTRFRR
jgi:hypothetical protein